jgi:hypothetical protein
MPQSNSDKEIRPKRQMRCFYCKCPLAAIYTTDNGVYCDNVCAVLDNEAQQAEYQLPVKLTSAEISELMDS